MIVPTSKKLRHSTPLLKETIMMYCMELGAGGHCHAGTAEEVRRPLAVLCGAPLVSPLARKEAARLVLRNATMLV